MSRGENNEEGHHWKVASSICCMGIGSSSIGCPCKHSFYILVNQKPRFSTHIRTFLRQNYP